MTEEWLREPGGAILAVFTQRLIPLSVESTPWCMHKGLQLEIHKQVP